MPLSLRPPRAPLALIAALFVLQRLAAVLALGDVFFYGEEREKAAAGKLLLERWDVPRHLLAYHPYEGGGFVTSHLDALAFALAGPSLLTLKLVALAWSTATLVLGARFVARRFGAAASVVFALLFAFAPASLQLASLLNLGIHFQALFFVPLILGPALAIAIEGARGSDPHQRQRRDDGMRAWRIWFAFGIASGFGVYYSYQCVVPVAAGLAAIALLRPRAFARRAANAGWIGALLGAAPLLWMASRFGGAVLDIHGQRLVGAEPAAGLVATLRAFSTALYSAPTAAGIVVPLVAAGALAAGFRPRAWTAPSPAGPAGSSPETSISARRAWLVLVGFLALEVAAYALSGFAVGAFAHPFALNRLSFIAFAAVLVAAPPLANALAQRGAARRLAVAALAAWCLASVAGTLRLVLDGRPQSPRQNLAWLASTRGYDWPQYLAKIAPRLDGDGAAKLARFMAIEEPDQPLLQRSAVLALTDAWVAEGRTYDELRALFEQQPVADWRAFLPGLAGWLRATTARADPAARLAALDAFPLEDRPGLAQAVARWGEGLHPFWERLEREVAIEPPTELAEGWYRGFGERLHEASRLDPERAAQFLERVPEPRRAAVERGYAWAVRAERLP